MPDESNVDVVLGVFAAINRLDVDAALRSSSEDVVLDFSESDGPYRGIYEGRASVGRFWRDFISSWDWVAGLDDPDD